MTGASSGLGFETALELARHGAEVTLGVRDGGRGAAAAERIRASVGGANVSVGEVDLADLASVRALAAGWTGPLHLLVNNAGVMALPYGLTVDGFEMQLGTNHLGHFALTGLLLPALLRGTAEPNPARVVTVASGAHWAGRIDLEDLQGERRYRRWEAYAQSKLANLLFAFELDRRASAAGLGLISVAAHPGYAATNLQSAGPRMEGRLGARAFYATGNLLLGQSAARGALPQLYAATAPDVRGGEYFGPRGPFEWRGSPVRVRASARANDPDLARDLWEESVRLTGVAFEGLE